MPQPESNVPQGSESKETLEHTRLGDAELQSVHAQLLREKSEPSEGFQPMPLYLVFIFAGLAFFAGVYLVEFGGGMDPFIYNENLKPGMAVESGPVEFDPIRAGQRFYTANCVACHQANGAGVPGAFPPLQESKWVTGPEGKVIRILLNGLVGPIEVRGQLYNGNMPAFGTSSDRQIAAVLTFIRTNSEWGNNASEITEEMVQQVREEVGARTQQWTAPELEALFEGAET